jgi:hypothetical protein
MTAWLSVLNSKKKFATPTVRGKRMRQGVITTAWNLQVISVRIHVKTLKTNPRTKIETDRL